MHGGMHRAGINEGAETLFASRTAMATVARIFGVIVERSSKTMTAFASVIGAVTLERARFARVRGLEVAGGVIYTAVILTAPGTVECPRTTL